MPSVRKARGANHLSWAMRASQWLAARTRNAAAITNIDNGLASICHDSSPSLAAQSVAKSTSRGDQDNLDQRVLQLAQAAYAHPRRQAFSALRRQVENESECDCVCKDDEHDAEEKCIGSMHDRGIDHPRV